MIGQEPKLKGHRLLSYYWHGVATISPDTLCLTSYLTIKFKISSRATIPSRRPSSFIVVLYLRCLRETGLYSDGFSFGGAGAVPVVAPSSTPAIPTLSRLVVDRCETGEVKSLGGVGGVVVEVGFSVSVEGLVPPL